MNERAYKEYKKLTKSLEGKKSMIPNFYVH